MFFTRFLSALLILTSVASDSGHVVLQSIEANGFMQTMQAEQEDGDLHVAILTVLDMDQSKDRFEHCADSLKSLGFEQVETVSGVNYHSFYPSDDEISLMGWSEEQHTAERMKANKGIFDEFKKTHSPTVAFPSGFEDNAVKKLFPGQIACFLGHWNFWELASKKPEGHISLILEDDAKILKEHSQVLSSLQNLGGASKMLCNLMGCTGGSFGLGNTMGYAVTSEAARQLLTNVDGTIPVDWAINQAASKGLISGKCPHEPLVARGYGAETSTKQFLVNFGETAKATPIRSYRDA
jgi:GR25 family glycosyltransferase involved in LPS biosynthesis